MLLPVNLNDLLSARSVESNRIEFKEGWNPDAIYRTICAFANDFDNGGGGYVVIGVAEAQGRAQRPVKGLNTEEIARIQREMIGYNNLIRPVYHPRLYVEEVDGQQIIVLWVMGSPERPHAVPEQITAKQKQYAYYVRQYANTMRANPEQQQELIAMTNSVPFDDRANLRATLADMSLLWIREYLRVSGSRLAEATGQVDTAQLLDQMGLLSGPPEMRHPRNAALMLFCEYPDRFFPYTVVELVDFRQPAGEATRPDETRRDKAFTEYTFRGPVQWQIKQLLDTLKTLVVVEMVIKVVYQPEAIRPFSYPPRVLEEAIANCFYHRDYQRYDPVRVYIHPDRIIFQNGGGPDRALRPDDFQTGRIHPRHYRNRRLGSFLKALDLTEGFATGIRLMLDEMARNGSAPPIFSMDDERTYFAVEFLLHPAFTEGAGVAATTGKGKTAAAMQLLSKLEPNSIAILKAMPALPIRRKDVLGLAQLSNETRNATRYLDPLIELRLLTPTIVEHPKSPLQQYRLTLIGEDIQQALLEQ